MRGVPPPSVHGKGGCVCVKTAVLALWELAASPRRWMLLYLRRPAENRREMGGAGKSRVLAVTERTLTNLHEHIHMFLGDFPQDITPGRSGRKKINNFLPPIRDGAD